MDFTWSTEQTQLRRRRSRFARAELNQDLVERDRPASSIATAGTKCGEIGIQGLPVPEEYGGHGLRSR